MMFFSILGIDKNPLKYKCSTLNVNMILRFRMKDPKLNACHILQKRWKNYSSFYDYILAQESGHLPFICLCLPTVNTSPNFAFLFFPMVSLTRVISVTVTGDMNYSTSSEIWFIEYSWAYAGDIPRICQSYHIQWIEK